MESDEDILKIFNEKDLKNAKWQNFIKDLFWPISHWPKHIIRNLFYCEYCDRLSLTSFLYKNGFPPDYFLDFIQFYARPSKRGTLWEIRKRELLSIWKLCENIEKNGSMEKRKKYFYYSMNDKLVYNYANEVKYFGVTYSNEKLKVNKFVTENNQKVQETYERKKEDSESKKRKHLTLSDFEKMTEDYFKKVKQDDSKISSLPCTQGKFKDDSFSDSDTESLPCTQESSETRRALDYLKLRNIDDLFSDEEEKVCENQESANSDSDDEFRKLLEAADVELKKKFEK